MRTQKLRAAIIGLGVGEAHIEGYNRHPQCEVVALCDIDPAKIAAAKEKYPSLLVTDDANQLLRSPDIDIVSIASFDNYHHAQAIEGLRHGKHLFIEKPLCLHEWEFADIARERQRAPQLKISSNLILRAYPRFLRLREMIRGGDLGELYCLETAYDYGRIQKLHSSWRGQLEYYSIVLGGAIHLVDLMLWLTGDTVTEVHAYGNATCSRGSQFKFEDFVMATMKFESGLVGKVNANFGCVLPHFHEISAFGTKATFLNTLQGAWLYTSRDPAVQPHALTEPYPGAVKGDLLLNFVDSILQDKEPAISWREISAVMAICFAIHRSLAEGGPVKVGQP